MGLNSDFVLSNKIFETKANLVQVILYADKGVLRAAKAIGFERLVLQGYSERVSDEYEKNLAVSVLRDRHITLVGQVLSLLPRVSGGAKATPQFSDLISANSLQRWLMANPNVNSIDLGSKGITDADMVKLSIVLCSPQIVELHLHNNQIGDEGIKALAGALKDSSVKYVNVGGNRIGTDGFIALIKSVPKTLETLDVGSNQIRAEGAQAAVGIIAATGIKNLLMQHNPLEAEGIRVLYESFMSPFSTLALLRIGKSTLSTDLRTAVAGLPEQKNNNNLDSATVSSTNEVWKKNSSELLKQSGSLNNRVTTMEPGGAPE